MEAQETLAYAVALAAEQAGGTLATHHAEDGTPYVTYVFAHMLADGRTVFGSTLTQQHSRNITATHEVSFLWDNRQAVHEDWSLFDRVIIEGSATIVPRDHPEHETMVAALGAKGELAAHFATNGELFCITPRRIILRRGRDSAAQVVAFEG